MAALAVPLLLVRVTEPVVVLVACIFQAFVADILDGGKEGDIDVDIEGEIEGEREGDIEGDVDGDRDGEIEGLADGEIEGEAEGLVDGLMEADGEAEGLAEGEIEGEAEGEIDGLVDGEIETETEGDMEGDTEDTGSIKTTPEPSSRRYPSVELVSIRYRLAIIYRLPSLGYYFDCFYLRYCPGFLQIGMICDVSERLLL